jgi:NHL repeat
MDTLRLTAYPERWLGGPAPGGLALPPAQPTRNHLYAPRGVYVDNDVLVVADSGNHRVLIWYGWPENDHAPADIVLGQPDFETEGPKLFHLPTGVAIIKGKLFVADAWHHRLLIWETLPKNNNQPPDDVLGQDNLWGTSPNRGGNVCPTGFYWPYGFAYINGWFYVADTGNRRVVGWKGLPEDGAVPDLILGQPNGYENSENRGKGVGIDTYRWPHALAGDEHTLYVADAGNHRILGYTPPPESDRPADLVLGQQDFTQSFELPHVPQGPRRFRFPYGIARCGNWLAVADTSNSRILLYPKLPRKGAFHPASYVIGQADFEGMGENRWQAVTAESLCWPYGIWFHQNRLAIADSGNNRVIIWRLEFE